MKMAVKKTCATITPCGLLVVIICFLWSVSGQENEDDSKSTTAKLEDTVFADMLKIVDSKFDTLTTRITALENAVSGLQFYSIRHFRQISGSLQSADNGLETVKKQVTQLENDSRAQTAVVSLLSADVSELKKTSADLLSEFESSVFYINENLDKLGNFVKTVVEETVVRSARETTGQISKEIEDFVRQLDKPKLEPVPCKVDFSSISEHIDLRFAEFKMQTHAHFVKLINAAKFDMRRGKRFSVAEVDNEEADKKVKDKICDCTAELKKNITVKIEDVVKPSSNMSSSRSDNTDNTSGAENGTSRVYQDAQKKYQDENDEQVMNALNNMTSSVLQAVSYFRNTGRLLEQVLSNTDSLALQQTDLTRRLDGWIGTQAASPGEESEHSNVIPGADHVGHQQVSPLLSGEKHVDRSCVLPVELFNNVANIMKNGSQLLEVLTDLAQLSSLGLSKSTSDLRDEVTRVERIRTQIEGVMLNRTTSDDSESVARLANLTLTNYRRIEEITSNTEWLPEILNSVHNLESLANHSFHTVMNNQVALRLVQQTMVTARESNENQMENTPAPSSAKPHRNQGGNQNVPSREEIVLNRESLETMYSTSLQLNRIMPALTKMLSEPDPLITLVGGRRPDQGRVEIYYNGLWGGLCQADLSHDEADVICRSLGFRGGISAGAGHFGPGAGVTWAFNASCLVSSECPVVTYSESADSCSHDMDSGVICDNMLRLVSSDGSIKGDNGRLEIHHRGIWLPVCSTGWNGYSARVACQQMGFTDGRETGLGEWQGGANTTWLTNIVCSGRESRLNACRSDGWRDSCPGLVPAGVRCV